MFRTITLASVLVMTVTAAQAEPLALSATQMDGITAGGTLFHMGLGRTLASNSGIPGQGEIMGQGQGTTTAPAKGLEGYQPSNIDRITNRTTDHSFVTNGIIEFND